MKQLKTLEQHNAERLGYSNGERPTLNGIECPNCGEELLDSNPNTILTSNPPQKNVHCSICGYKGYRIA